MATGAKTGENRFKNYQGSSTQYRMQRIEEIVIPRLKTLIGKASFTGKTGFCKVCEGLYNDNLPINEKPIGYRTLEQNQSYWQLLGEYYFRHWGANEDTDTQANNLRGKLAIKNEKLLKEQLELIIKENEALKAALRNHGASDSSLPAPQPPTGVLESELIDKFDKTCRALNLVIKATDGTIEVDTDAVKIICHFDALEDEKGLVPKELAQPYVTWWLDRKKKTGGRT